MEKYSPLSKITYRNDFLKTPVKEVAIFNLEQRYDNFFEVLSFPIKKNSKHYFIYLRGKSIKKRIDQIKKSGDWYFSGRLSRKQKRLIDKIKNENQR